MIGGRAGALAAMRKAKKQNQPKGRKFNDKENRHRQPDGLDADYERDLMKRYGLERVPADEKKEVDQGEILKQFRGVHGFKEDDELERQELADLDRVRQAALAQERGQYDHHAELDAQRKKMEAEEKARELEELADEEAGIHYQAREGLE